VKLAANYWGASLALMLAACGGSPPTPSESLKNALAGRELGLAVTLGTPSQLHLADGAAEYTSGNEDTGAKSLQVGTRAQLRLGVKSSEASVHEPGFPAGVKLTPVVGPQRFSSWGKGVAAGDAVVYVSRDGQSAVVERARREGLKEDIVLTRSLGDALRFEWQLSLGEGLEARLDADGSVGVYSKAERRFQLPAPVVRTATGKPAEGVARFELGNGRLALVATGLDALAYPLSLDPSVLVTTAADFGLGGNLEDGVDFDTAADRVKRQKTQWGLGAFAATTPFALTGRTGHTSVAYNGFLYVIGGESPASHNDVLFAPITLGAVGAFTATTSFTTPRYYHASVAYNGYLYVIGGADGLGSVLSDVQFAPIHADGTLGTFSQTTPIPTARDHHAGVAYKGYLYILGGYSGPSGLSDVQVAPFRADGTLGDFTSTTPLPAGRWGHTSVAHDGHLYVIGGGTTGIFSDVQMASVNADGTLGAFTATTPLPGPSTHHGSVVANGHLYVVGGNGALALSDVYVAPINANGTLGAFASTTSLPAFRSYFPCVAYNGYLFVLGGSTSAGRQSDVLAAPLNGSGTGALGSFTSVTPVVGFGTRDSHASVAYNGYLYVVGGVSGATPVSDVQMTPLGVAGTVGSFVGTTPLPTARSMHAGVAYDGYLYVIGGYDGVAPLAEVLAAPINSDGTLGAFGATTSLPTARFGHASVVYNGYLYVIGGFDTGALAEVLRAPINPSGTLGTFTATTPLPNALASHTSVAYGGRLYVIGGDGPTRPTQVQFAPINANGSLGAFTATAPLPSARWNHDSVAYDGYLYVTGGTDGISTLGTVLRAPINATGALGAFTLTSSLNPARSMHGTVASNGYVFVVGGRSSFGSLGDVQVAPINGHSAVGTFGPAATFPTARSGHATVAANGYLYVLGGYSGPANLNDVQRAPLNANGTVGTFAATTSFTGIRQRLASAAYGGHLYVIGGKTSGGGPALADVQVATINTDGSLSTFVPTTSLATARWGHTSVAYNGHLYIVGGHDNLSTNLADVQVATINADGSLGAFTPTSSFTTGRNSHSSVVYNGYLYVIGGFGAEALLDVQAAPINADGSLGAFANTASLPAATFAHSSVAQDGFLYVIGGTASSALVSPINTNGSLGGFSVFPAPSAAARSGHGSVAANGYLYVTGGHVAIPDLADVLAAPLLTPAAVGHYSKLIDLGAPGTVVSLTVNGSATTGLIHLDHRTAQDAGVFGPTVTREAIPLGAAVPLGEVHQRYLWVHFTLDDTLAAVIDPDATNARDITDFTLVYNPDPVLTPASASTTPKGSQAFTCSGGSDAGYVYTVSPNPSGGSINSSSGAYVAGATGSVSDTVVCTDSAAATASATVMVTAGISITPSNPTIPPRGSRTFTAAGGSGASFTWAYTAGGNLSGGTLSTGGAYVAGTTPSVADILQVTDSLGNTATAVVNVGPALLVVPATVTLPPKGSLTLTADGGGPGRTWSTVTNNSGMTIVAATGLYTAGPTGNVTDEVRVVDSLTNTANRLITVTGGVSVSPLTATVYPRGTQLFTPDGGSKTGFTWALTSNASGGAIDGGRYVAGINGSVTDVAEARDSLGNTGSATITVTAGVSASPSSANVVPRGSASFGADGGSGVGYSWSFLTNVSGGAVTPSGAYTAGDAGTVLDVLKVTDSVGNEGLATILVLPGVTISPASPSTPPSGTVNFSAADGSGTGWAWSLIATGSGSPNINPTSGVYAAGTAQGTDTVKVTDSLGNSATVDVTVTNALAITPGTVSLAPRELLTFTGTGGSDAGYVWTLQTNNSGATFNPATAAYQAGATPLVADTIRLTDSLSNIATATVNVGAGVSLSPAAPTAAPRSGLTFAASGGKAGAKTWSFQTNASGGTIGPASGAYVAGATGSVTDVVLATDSLGNTGTASVSVSAGVSIAPAAPTVVPRGALTLTASGGSDAGFLWALVTNASGGTLAAGTGAYAAGSTGSVTDVVQATDSLGNVALRNVSVSAGVSISPTAPSVAPHGTILLTATGGSGSGYSWFLTNNRSGANLSPTSGVYQAGSTSKVVDELQVVDSLGNTATGTVNVTDQMSITPQLPTVAPRQSQTFTALNATGTVSWTLTLKPSGGSIDPDTGVYVAGATGGVTDTVRATDSIGNSAATNITVTAALAVAPTKVTLAPKGTRTFTAQGGSPDGGYEFSVSPNLSGATINPATGEYQAGAVGSVTDTIKVTDGMGATATALVTVTDAVSISPSSATVNTNAAQTFTAAGGSGAGFTFSLSAKPSGGNINAETGEYVAGPTGNVDDTVAVTDSFGNTATARVTVVPAAAPKAPPPGEDKPVNGWGCGCQGTGASASGLLGLALLALLLPRRRRFFTGTWR
jgi:MYXO-CTERM domain-containing protein